MTRDSLHPIGRRKFLKSSTLVAGGGILVNSVSASRKTDDGELGTNFSEKITIEDGKAKASGDTWEMSGQAVTYTPQDFAEDINKGVRDGIWKALKISGEIKLKLTRKGQRFFDQVQSEAGLDTPLHGKRHSASCDGVNKEVGDTAYIDDEVTDSIVDTLHSAGTVMQVAGILVGAIGAWTTGPFGIITGAALTAAGTLLSAGASYIANKNDGCGIKIKNLANVQTQECNC